MMKRSIFGKLLAIAMVFAGFSLTSCDENDNAIIDGKVWVRPEVKLVDGGAIITGSSTADINRMLSRVRQEIIQAANKSEKFTIDIQTSVLNSTAGDNTLNIVAVDGGDIVLNLPANIVTDVPLIIQKQGVTDNEAPLAPPAIPNKVEINIPSSASNIDLGINMPTSTVTLTGGTIENLTAKTALSTLIIESGVTINWLKMLGGRALVKDGGKVLGYLRDGSESEGDIKDAYVSKEGVNPVNGDYGPDVYYIKDEASEPYYAQNLKIVKGESLKVARVSIENGLAENDLEVIIADGAAAAFSFSYISDEGKSYAPKVSSIKGEGNKTAKIYCWNPNESTDEGKTIYSGSTISLEPVKEISNVSVDNSTHPEYAFYSSGKWNYSAVDIIVGGGDMYLPSVCTDCDFKSQWEIYGVSEFSKVTNCNFTTPQNDKNYNGNIHRLVANNCKLIGDNINISGNCENCTFNGRQITFNNYYISGNSATVKNCKFETSSKYNLAAINLPYQTKDRSSFNFTFNTCNFEKGYWFNISYEGEKPWKDKDGKLITKAYFWWVLNDDGTVKTNPATSKRSADEKDIPAANKANGECANGSGYWDPDLNTWVYTNGYWISESNTGWKEDAFYKDYKGFITLENTTLDGKAITKDTDFISDVQSGYDEKREIATTTRFVIGGVSYKAVLDSDSQKWFLIDAE